MTGAACRRWQLLKTESETDISILVLGPILSLVLPMLFKREEAAVWRSEREKPPFLQALFYFWVKEPSHAAFLGVSNCPMEKKALVSGHL